MRFDRLVLTGLLLVLPVAFWTGSTSYDAVKFTLLALAGAAWLGSLAWRLGTGRGVALPPRGLVAAGVSLLAVLAVSVIRAHNADLVLRTTILVALWLAVVFQAATTTDSFAGLRRLAAASVAAGTLAGLYGMAQIFGLLPGAPPASGYPPGISTLGNQNYLGGLAAVLVWPSVILWSGAGNPRRILAVSATFILVATVVAARAMGPVLALGVSFFIAAPCLTATWKGGRAKIPLMLGASLILAGGLGLATMADFMRPPPDEPGTAQAIHRRLFQENHGSVRRTDWLVAGQMFLSSPVTGRGAGNYAALWPATRAELDSRQEIRDLAEHEPLAVQAHNEVFQFLGETGLLGGVWLLAMALVGVRSWGRKWRGLPDRRTGSAFLLLTAALIVAGIHSMVSFPFHLPATAVVLAMTIGLIFSPAMAGRPAPLPTWRGKRALAVVPAVLAFILAGGSARKMVGDLHLAAGERYFAAASLDGAAFHLEKGTNLVPWPGQGNLYLGLVRLAAGNEEIARAPLEKSLQESPTFEGFLALAEICIDQGRFGEADRHLTVVEGCKPIMTFRIQTKYLRGLAELRQGRQEKARLLFRELLNLDPDNQRAWLALGYQEVLAGNSEQARIYYRRALEIIDRKMGQSSSDPGQNAPGNRARLNRHRQAALKALQSVS